MPRWVLWLLLILGAAGVAYPASNTPYHTQTLSPFPLNDASFFANTQSFLANEEPLRFQLLFNSFVAANWQGPVTGPGFGQTVPAFQAFVNGYYVSQGATPLTLLASRRTYVFVDWLDTRTSLAPPQAEVAFTGGTGCGSFQRFTRLLTITCAIGSPAPTPSVPLMVLYYSDTNASAVVAVNQLANTSPVSAAQSLITIKDEGTSLPQRTELNFAGAGVSCAPDANPNMLTCTIPDTSTSAGTPNTIVRRDASGNFTAGTITANLQGSSARATQLQTLPIPCGAFQSPTGVDTFGNSVGCFAVTTLSQFQGHTTSASNAHAASSISFVSTGTITSSTVQDAIVQVSSMAAADLAAHLGNTTGAHAASAINFSPTGTIAAGTVQSAIAEVASEALQKSSNLSDLANVATARTNLGLGTSATLNVGTIAGTVAAGDDTRLSNSRSPINAVSPCVENEIAQTHSGLWQCATPPTGGGGGGTPGGADTQVQYNKVGAFAGDTGLTFNDTTKRLTTTGGFVGSLIGNASTASAFDHTPTGCGSNVFATGIAASGNLSCTAVSYVGLTNVPTQLVRTDQSNTYSTGAQNFGGATSLTVPVSPAANPTVSGQIAYDSTSNTLEAGVNGVNRTIAYTTSSITGNAATATQLQGPLTTCAVGNSPRGIDTFGNAINCFDVATQTELDAHLTNSLGAHAANAISFAAAGTGLTSTTVQGAIQEATTKSGTLVAVATTGNITLSGEQTLDSITTNASRVLVWQQIDPTQNGIYVSSFSTWQRATDFANAAQFVNNFSVYVQSGQLYGNNTCRYTNTAPITMGSNAISFACDPGPKSLKIADYDTASGVPRLRSDVKLKPTEMGSYAALAPLSAASAIPVDVNTPLFLGIEFSGGPGTQGPSVNPRIQPGIDKQPLILVPSHPTNFVTIPTGNGVRWCGNAGSVTVGEEFPIMAYDAPSSTWWRLDCTSADQAFKTKPSVTLYACGDPRNPRYGDIPAGNYWEDCLDAGVVTRRGYCGGGLCPSQLAAPLGGTLDLLSDNTLIARLTQATNSFDFVAGFLHLRGGAGSPAAADCDASGEARRIWIQTDAADTQMLWVCKGASGWKQQGGGGGGASDINVQVTRNAAQSISNNTDTPLQFNAENFDTNTFHDNVTNNSRITFATTGKYAGSCVFWFVSNDTGIRQGAIRKNGTTSLSFDLRTALTGGIDTPLSVTLPATQFSATDYVELMVYQNSGVSLNIAQASYTPFCSFFKVN